MKNILANNFLGIIKDAPSIGTSLLISIAAIVGVFLILYIIILCIQLMQKIIIKFEKNSEVEEKQEVQESAPVEESPKSVEIVDDDMMVAALIATIDYTSETKKDVKLKSIKRIG